MYKVQPHSLDEVTYTLDNTEKILGLKIYYDKTGILILDLVKNTKNTSIHTKPMSWRNEPIRIVWIDSHHNMNEIIE